MTENGGGRDSGAREADSWFKPSENRYRTQSEYQDPMEDGETGDTVFPDSGGYAGLSTSRPPMVEPYPEALGGPPQATPPAPPTPGALSYPGASPSAYEPLTRVPGEPVSEDEPSFPGIAASAEVPLPPESEDVPWNAGDARDRPWATGPEYPSVDEPRGAGDTGDLDGEPWSPGAAAVSGGPSSGPAVPSSGGAGDGSADQPWSVESASSSAGEPWGTGEAGDRGDDLWSPESDGAPGDESWESDAVSSFGGAGDGSADQPWSVESASSPAGEPWNAGGADGLGDEPWSSGGARADEPWSAEPDGALGEERWDSGLAASSAPAPPESAIPSSDAPGTPGDAGGLGGEPWSPDPAAVSGGPSSGSAVPSFDEPWASDAGPSFDEPRGGSADRPWSVESASSPAGEPWNAGGLGGEPWSPDPAATSSGPAASPLDETDRPWSSDPASPSADAPWGTGPDPSASAPAEPAAPAAGEPWTPDSALDRVNEAWSPGTPPANEPWTPGDPTDDGLGPRPPMPSAEGPDPLAPRPDSWADDELGSDSWGTDARRPGDPGAPRAWDERTDDLDTWTSARDGDGAGAAEPWTGRSGDGYDDELSPAPAPVEQDPPGGGTGNTWVFDRDDARLPDSVREAERRRRENGPARPEFREWGADTEDPDTGALSAAVPASDDPLGAIAEMQTRARSQDEAEVRDADQEPGGATQMFDALSFDDAEPDADRYGAPAYDDGDYDGYGDGYDDPRYTEDGYAEDGYAGQPYDSRYHDTGYDEDTADGYDDAPRAAAPGVPSDLGPAPEGAAGPHVPDAESEYDDGFTPADYGMPVDRSKQRRRRDPIASDFPGFDDRPPGGEVGDAYPGYDSIEFLADTERGALVTLWLGLASLLPGIGLATAAVALFVTGPKARRAIRGSNGQLDGLGLITTGTVFAVVGVLVTVISVAFFFVL